jgi:hypothetical protein
MATILNSADCDAIRSRAGATTGDLSDEDLISHAYVFEAEREIAYQISLQPLVDSVAVIMAKPYSGPAMDLKQAALGYVVSKFYVAATNALNTAITTGDQTVDRGGIGAQWHPAQDESLKEADRCLTRLPGWNNWRKITS